MPPWGQRGRSDDGGQNHLFSKFFDNEQLLLNKDSCGRLRLEVQKKGRGLREGGCPHQKVLYEKGTYFFDCESNDTSFVEIGS